MGTPCARAVSALPSVAQEAHLSLGGAWVSFGGRRRRGRKSWERTGAEAFMGSMFDMSCFLLAQEWKFEIHNFYLLASSLCGSAQSTWTRKQ